MYNFMIWNIYSFYSYRGATTTESFLKQTFQFVFFQNGQSNSMQAIGIFFVFILMIRIYEIPIELFSIENFMLNV